MLLAEVAARSIRQVEVAVFFILGDERLNAEEQLAFAVFKLEDDSTCSANEKSLTKSPIPISEIAPRGVLEVGDRAATRVEWKLRKKATARSYSASFSVGEDIIFTDVGIDDRQLLLTSPL